MATDREACGRCSMSTAVDVANAGRDDDERSERDPYGDERIEVDERDLRMVSPRPMRAGQAPPLQFTSVRALEERIDCIGNHLEDQVRRDTQRDDEPEQDEHRGDIVQWGATDFVVGF